MTNPIDSYIPFTTTFPKRRRVVPAGISFGLGGGLLRLRWLDRGDLAHGLSEGVLVAAGAYFTRRVDELLALRPGVFSLGLFGLWHGVNVTDLRAHCEVRHG